MLPLLRVARCAALFLSSLATQVRSLSCNLHALNKQELKEHGEEAMEFGGYFIVNGIERIIRLLINQRRHYILGMVRGAYSRRGATFTEFATAIRCVSPDETSMTVRTHYMTNGSARLAFVLRRQEFFIPARGPHAPLLWHRAERTRRPGCHAGWCCAEGVAGVQRQRDL